MRQALLAVAAVPLLLAATDGGEGRDPDAATPEIRAAEPGGEIADGPPVAVLRDGVAQLELDCRNCEEATWSTPDGRTHRGARQVLDFTEAGRHDLTLDAVVAGDTHTVTVPVAVARPYRDADAASAGDPGHPQQQALWRAAALGGLPACDDGDRQRTLCPAPDGACDDGPGCLDAAALAHWLLDDRALHGANSRCPAVDSGILPADGGCDGDRIVTVGELTDAFAVSVGHPAPTPPRCADGTCGDASPAHRVDFAALVAWQQAVAYPAASGLAAARHGDDVSVTGAARLPWTPDLTVDGDCAATGAQTWRCDGDAAAQAWQTPLGPLADPDADPAAGGDAAARWQPKGPLVAGDRGWFVDVDGRVAAASPAGSAVVAEARDCDDAAACEPRLHRLAAEIDGQLVWPAGPVRVSVDGGDVLDVDGAPVERLDGAVVAAGDTVEEAVRVAGDAAPWHALLRTSSEARLLVADAAALPGDLSDGDAALYRFIAAEGRLPHPRDLTEP